MHVPKDGDLLMVEYSVNDGEVILDESLFKVSQVHAVISRKHLVCLGLTKKKKKKRDICQMYKMLSIPIEPLHHRLQHPPVRTLAKLLDSVLVPHATVF